MRVVPPRPELKLLRAFCCIVVKSLSAESVEIVRRVSMLGGHQTGVGQPGKVFVHFHTCFPGLTNGRCEC